MIDFKFNTLYIIESLRDDEPKTGTILYEDLKLQEFVHEGIKVVLYSIISADEWDITMQKIYNDCACEGVLPIIHLEIHGSENGIQFTNGSLRSVEQIGEQFRKINIVTGCNLFVTLGVCKGLYMLFDAHLDKPMPFCCIIGSFEKLISEDIKLRYAEFYGTFFNTFDVTKAYIQLMKTDTGVNPLYTQYRYIHIDELFYRTYNNYINIECSPTRIKARALQAALENNIVLKGRRQTREFQRDFEKIEEQTRQDYYKKACRIFFMLDEHPENITRFEVPDTYEQLACRCKKIVTI